MSHIVAQPDHGQVIGEIEGEGVVASPRMRLFIDELVQKLNDDLFGEVVRLHSHTVADLPEVPPADKPAMIFVSDETGGAVPAFSDGTNWRRTTDRAIVS